MSLLISIVAFAFLIFIHEFGHFYVARKLGVDVEKFSIGFGKVLWSKMHNGTKWQISLIPLGGYVQMKGQDDKDPTKIVNEEGSYSILHPINKIAILLAGPLANLLLAFVIYIFLAFYNYQILMPKIGTVLQNSPAMEAKLQKNDIILQINNDKIHKWEDISNSIKKNKGQLRFLIQRNTKKQVLTITPKIMQNTNIFKEKVYKKMVGIAPLGEIKKEQLSFLKSIDVGFDNTIKSSTLIFQSIIKLASGVIDPKEVGSVISIVDATNKATNLGIYIFLGLVALISVNLGILNLLPIPALDGGHIMFNLYELITKRPISLKIINYLTIFGWVFLLSLMSLGVYNDLNRMLG